MKLSTKEIEDIKGIAGSLAYQINKTDADSCSVSIEYKDKMLMISVRALEYSCNDDCEAADDQD